VSAASSLAPELVATSPWQSRYLGDIVDILDSKRKPITKRDRVAGPYPYYGATGVLDWVSGFTFDEPLVLIGEDGAKWGAGDASAFAVSGKTWVNNHAHVLRPHREIVTDEWLIYYLNASDLSEFISGMTVPKLNQGRLREIRIPIPPLEEQKRVVAVLDQAFAALDRACALTEANLADAEEFFDSWASEAFRLEGVDRPTVYLPDISENLDRSRVPITKADRKPGNVPYYGASGEVDRVADFIFDEDLLLVSEDGANLLARTYPIAFSISGKSWVNNHAHVLRFANPTDQEYVRLYLNSIPLDDFVSGMAQPKLNQKALNSIPILFPPDEERARIVEKAAEISAASVAAMGLYDAQLTDVVELRQSLLQKAFAGELT
jgi:type I restriction enzyme, S subunit